MGVFVDTSAWFAAASIDSRTYGPVVDHAAGASSRLMTSNFIVSETITLIRARPAASGPDSGWASLYVGDKIWRGKLAS